MADIFRKTNHDREKKYGEGASAPADGKEEGVASAAAASSATGKNHLRRSDYDEAAERAARAAALPIGAKLAASCGAAENFEECKKQYFAAQADKGKGGKITPPH